MSVNEHLGLWDSLESNPHFRTRTGHAVGSESHRVAKAPQQSQPARLDLLRAHQVRSASPMPKANAIAKKNKNHSRGEKFTASCSRCRPVPHHPQAEKNPQYAVPTPDCAPRAKSHSEVAQPQARGRQQMGRTQSLVQPSAAEAATGLQREQRRNQCLTKPQFHTQSSGHPP